MARAIPTYEQQRTISGVQSAPTASSSVRADNPAFSGLANVGNAMGNLAGTLQVEARKKEEDRASVEVANILSQGDVYWQENMAQRMNGWKVGDADLRDGIGKDFDKWVSESVAKLPTDASRKYFKQHAARTKATLQQNAYTFQDKSTTEKLNADTLVGIEADETVVYGNAAKRDEVYARRMETVLARNDISEAEKIKMASSLKSKLNLAAERGEMERDPVGWYTRRFGGLPEAVGGKIGRAGAAPAEGFDGVMGAIFKHEGGYTASDGNSGAPANFGINQRANPDIDVKNLTKERAAEIYKTRYWDKIGGDNLPAGLQGTAMDAAVNQGVGNAKKWIEQSGGDPARFNELRRDHYESMLAKPEYAKYRKTWMARLAFYENGGGAEGAGTVADAPKTFSGIGFEQQRQMKAQAEQRIQQDNTRLMANAAIEVAEVAVSSQAIGTSGAIDLTMASAQAIDEAKARKGSDLTAVERQQVEAQVSHAAARRERDRKVFQDNLSGSMFDQLDKNGGDYQDLQRTMVREMGNLPRETLDRLQKYAGEVATGNTRPTDWRAYAQLVENPETLAAVNLAAIRDKFSRDEFNQLSRLQAAAKKAKEEGRPQAIQGDLAVVKDLLQGAKVKPNSEREAKFFALLQTAMDAEMAISGKTKMSQKEVKDLAADLLVKEVTSKGLFWDTKTPAFEIEVPQAEKTKIIAALQNKGMPVNESAILRVYRNKLQKNNPQQPVNVK